MLTGATSTEEDDPVLGQFLDFPARDIASHPERLRTVGANLANRIQSLTGGVEVDLNEALPEDDH